MSKCLFYLAIIKDPNYILMEKIWLRSFIIKYASPQLKIQASN